MKRTLWLAAGIVALVSANAYLRGDSGQALPWPETDIVPLAMRMADASFLPDDFFTNASAQPNPRWIQAWLVYRLGSLTDAPPIVVLLALRAALALALPALFIVAFVRIREVQASVERLCPAAPETVFRAFVILLVPLACLGATSWARVFSVALWSPMLGGHAAPSNVAVLLGSVGILLHERHRAWLRLGGLGFLFAAGLVHPLTGPALTAIYLLFKLAAGVGDWRRVVAAGAGGIAAPMATVALVFAPRTSPSAQVVTETYAYLRHPHHYVASMFGSLGVPWSVSFGLVCAVLLVNLAIGVRLRDRYHGLAAGLALGSYAGAVLAQYLFVEVLPIKAVVLLGPSRFTLFGYWLASILTARLVLVVWSRRNPSGLASALRAWDRASSAPPWAYHAAGGLLLLVALVLGVGAFLRSTKELDALRPRFEAAWSWAARDAGRRDPIVALPPDLPTSGVREIAGLSLLVDGYYPFDLDAIEDYGERYRALYGNYLSVPPDRRAAEQRAHYDGLDLRQVVEIGRRWPVDYWIMHAGAAARSELAGTAPVVGDESLVAYDYADLVDALERNQRAATGSGASASTVATMR